MLSLTSLIKKWNFLHSKEESIAAEGAGRINYKQRSTNNRSRSIQNRVTKLYAGHQPTKPSSFFLGLGPIVNKYITLCTDTGGVKNNSLGPTKNKESSIFYNIKILAFKSIFCLSKTMVFIEKARNYSFWH